MIESRVEVAGLTGRDVTDFMACLSLGLTPVPGGVSVRHTITAGWPGTGRMLDPLLRLHFTPGFTAELDTTCAHSCPGCGTTSCPVPQPARKTDWRESAGPRVER